MRYAILILGLLGSLLGGAVLLVSLLLYVLNEPRISLDEAMWGIVPGALILLLSLPIAVVGAVMVMKGRKQG
jgi:hypothetical protein